MIGTIKQRSVTTTLALFMCFAAMFAAVPDASAASGTMSGNVQCFYGNNQVVGIWVEVENGTDGWTSMSNDGIGGKNYSYTLSQATEYKLNVGCSGTPSSWGATMYTPPNLNGNYCNWVCSYSISYGFFCAMS